MTAAEGVSLILFPSIIRSVPSPSIFSPSSPKTMPTSAGMLISPEPFGEIDMSPFAPSTIAVSYTHLTLPTNREV